MKNSFLLIIVLAINLWSSPVFSQTGTKAVADTTSLGLPGDNLDLYAVLDLFQKSKTIEEFEKSLNTKETGVNNLDLNLDNKVDFIKVTTKQDGKNFTFVLQDDVNEKETQDVAVILVSKDDKGKVNIQIVGDKELYGIDYVVEPKPSAPAVTANPGYTGPEPVTVSTPATTSVVVVESAPIVQYVYSPAYVPYYPPYTYAYPPPYFAAFTIMAVGIYRHNNFYCHGGYHGGHGGNVYINNGNNYNNYNNSRRSSNTVNHNNANGNYNRNNAGASTRQSGGNNASTRQSGGNNASTRQSAGNNASSRSAASPSTNQSRGSSGSSRPSTSSSSRSSSSRSSSSRSNPGSFSGSRGGGGGGMSRGGGGGRRR
jgi:hypothetical protein